MSTEHSVADLVNETTSPKTNIVVHVTESPPAALAIDPLISHVGDGIFLQTKTAQGLAGVFVWIALFIACQQVSVNLLSSEATNLMDMQSKVNPQKKKTQFVEVSIENLNF